MAANKEKKKMLNASRGMKAISILVASCMLFALTGCDSKEESATTEVTTPVAGVTIAETTTTEATTTEATTTEATTTTPTTATTPTTEASTEATTAVPTATTTETPTETPSLTVPDELSDNAEAATAAPTTTTTETPTEAPPITVPDELPDNAEADVEEYTPEEHENEQAPQNPPADDPDNGYWHDEPTNITMADLQAEAEAAVAQISAVGASSHGQTISNSYVCRATDTQYGIYVDIINSSGEAWSSGIVKAENVDGSIQVYWAEHNLWDPVDDGYDNMTRYQDISVIYQQLRKYPD